MGARFLFLYNNSYNSFQFPSDFLTMFPSIYYPINEVKTIMKFITSTFNPNKMILDNDFDLRVHTLTEEEFHALILDAYSCVGYEDVALMLNVAYNHEPVKARVGDIILLADMNKGNLEYKCIQICPSEFPLMREDEIYAEEEMI